jgi:hypothetical protein
VRVNKSTLQNDTTYAAAEKRASQTYQNWNRTRNKLLRVEVQVPNPLFAEDAPESETNPKSIRVERNWYETRINSLQEQIDKIEAEYQTAAADVSEGDDMTEPGHLFVAMRDSKTRLSAIENKLLGIRPVESADADAVAR